MCSGCFSVFYCDAACQKAHWTAHKVVCKTQRPAALLAALGAATTATAAAAAVGCVTSYLLCSQSQSDFRIGWSQGVRRAAFERRKAALLSGGVLSALLAAGCQTFAQEPAAAPAAATALLTEGAGGASWEEDAGGEDEQALCELLSELVSGPVDPAWASHSAALAESFPPFLLKALAEGPHQTGAMWVAYTVLHKCGPGSTLQKACSAVPAAIACYLKAQLKSLQCDEYMEMSDELESSCEVLRCLVSAWLESAPVPPACPSCHPLSPPLTALHSPRPLACLCGAQGVTKASLPTLLSGAPKSGIRLALQQYSTPQPAHMATWSSCKRAYFPPPF